MLNALLRKKTQGIFRQDYKESFTGYEDSLTAMVFERLAYLSRPTVSRIFDSLHEQSGLTCRAADLGELLDCEFWPQWPAADGKRWVEPDVVMGFERAVLVVEAKRYDVSQQRFDQWAWELKSCPHIATRKLLLFAVGGLSDYELQHLHDLKSHALTGTPAAWEKKLARIGPLGIGA